MTSIRIRSRRGLPGVLAVAILASPAALAPLPARADRPSLEALEAEIQALRDDACTKADVDGDSYRPSYCDASCSPCIAAPNLAPQADACEEVSPGDFVFEFQLQGACVSNVSCAYLDLFCDAPSDCPKSPQVLGSSSWTCDMINHVCTVILLPGSCTTNSECDVAIATGAITGIGMPGTPGAAQCSVPPFGAEPGPPNEVPINYGDAQACVSLIESTRAISCQPAP